MNYYNFNKIFVIGSNINITICSFSCINRVKCIYSKYFHSIPFKGQTDKVNNTFNNITFTEELNEGSEEDQVGHESRI